MREREKKGREIAVGIQPAVTVGRKHHQKLGHHLYEYIEEEGVERSQGF